MKESELDKFFEPENDIKYSCNNVKCVIGYFGNGDNLEKVEKNI